MKPHRLHRWIAWLLPLFILRTFVPTGFMWAPSADGIQLILCSGAGAVVTAASVAPSDPGDHQHHHATAAAHDAASHHSASPSGPSHANHANPASQSAHQSSLCPFAAAGLTYIDTARPVVPPALADVRLDDVPFTLPTLDRQPPSAHRIRGPPPLV